MASVFLRSGRVGSVRSDRAPTLSTPEIDRIRRTRRRPRPTQFDYLHIRRLVDDIRIALARIEGSVRDVLDIYCGTRPYEDLMPASARVVGLDVEGNRYGLADVVSNEFLPFGDSSFDLVTCIEAFQFVEDPERGICEIRRVLRPGGAVLIAVPFAWEYDRTILEHRFTEPELIHLFRDWDETRVIENGGRAVTWTMLTGSIFERARERVVRPLPAVFPLLYLALNACGSLFDALERRTANGRTTLPMNLLVTARRPLDD
jgi:SAM-dependent methyltransferase